MRTNKTSQNGIELIKLYEGFHPKVYNIKNKEYKIGYGHTGKDLYERMIICKEQAEILLKYDIEENEKIVNDPSYVLMKPNQNEFDALVSFTFNLGKNNLKELVDKKSISQIANDLIKYNKLNGKENKRLTRRREAEKNLFLKEMPISPPIPIKNLDIVMNTNIGEYTLHMDTILEKTKDEYNFLIGDFNNRGYLDLFCIKRSRGDNINTEVHILDGEKNYKEWLFERQIPLKEQGADWDFCLGDYNHDGNLDLFCIRKNKTGTHSTEVHILSGKTYFQTYLLNDTGTILKETDNNYKFFVGDFNDDGELDLFCIHKNNTESNSFEVSILSGNSKYKSFLLQNLEVKIQIDGNSDNLEFGISNYLEKGKKIYIV